MNMKKTVSLLLLLLMLLGMIRTHADAAGKLPFDSEYAGIKQVYRYELREDDWLPAGIKEFEYYSDGTLKTVSNTMPSEEFYWAYEGHYDPHGVLMDPMFHLYARYVEGILLDPRAEPVRKYDSKGRLTHFEARVLEFDAPDVVTKVYNDYEYDSRDRVSRVHSRYLGEDNYEYYQALTDTGFVFSYADSGEYTVSRHLTTEWGNTSNTTFAYDADHRLISYKSESEAFLEDGARDYSVTIERYFYDDDGYLICQQEYLSEDGIGIDEPVYEYQYEYRRENDSTLLCDVYSKSYGDGEPELQRMITYKLDEAGRVVSEGNPASAIYSYNRPAALGEDGEAASAAPSVEDVRPFGTEITYPKRNSYLDHYETRTVKTPKGHSAAVYWKPIGEDTYLRRNYYIPEGTEVTVLAREGAFSCVIFHKYGKEHIGWVESSVLS